MTHITRFLLFLSLALALAPAMAAEPALPSGIARTVSVEGVTEYRLANGLRVLLVPDPSVDTITVNITYLVGPRHPREAEHLGRTEADRGQCERDHVL